MPTIAELKASSPAYQQMGDMEFASRIYRKHYADKMDFSTFAGKVGFDPYGDADGVDPNEGNSFAQNALEGLGKSFVDTAEGVGQLVGLVPQEQVDERRRLDAPLMDTGGGVVGNAAGMLTQIVAPGGVAKLATMTPRAMALAPRALPVLNAIKAASLPSTIKGATLQGAAIGAIQPTATGESRLVNTGLNAGLGSAGAVAARVPGLIGAGIRKLSPAMSAKQQTRSAGRVINQFAHDPQAVRHAAMNPQTIVPGSVPTLAEASGDMGLSGLQRTLANTPEFGNEFALRQQANNLARVKHIEGNFGGADSAAADAIRNTTRTNELPGLREARRQTGAESAKIISWIDRVQQSPRFRNNPLVEGALGTVRNMIAVPIDDAGRLSAARSIVAESLSKPRRRSAADFAIVKEARRLVISAQQQGVPADEVLRDIRKLKPSSSNVMGLLNDMSRSLKVAEKGRPDVASLYATRLYITGTMMKNADGATMQALRGAVGKLDERIGEVAPSYKQYLSNFAADMREADRVDVGAELLATGRAVRGSTNEPSLTPAAFGRAAGNMDRTVQRATEFKRATADRVLTKPQIAAVDAVRRDLERYSRALTDGKAVGSNTMQNAVGGNRLQDAAGPVGAAMIEPTSGLVMLAINQARKAYGERVGMLVNEAMMDPARAAEILALVPNQQRSQVLRMAGPALARLVVASSVSAVPAYRRQQPLEIDIIGGTPISADEAQRQYGR